MATTMIMEKEIRTMITGSEKMRKEKSKQSILWVDVCPLSIVDPSSFSSFVSPF